MLTILSLSGSGFLGYTSPQVILPVIDAAKKESFERMTRRRGSELFFIRQIEAQGGH